jgi:glycosyltransferase involved in cell wall biosynthesis
MSTLLWWGRSDNDYSRNRIILTLLEELGWQIQFFHPYSSQLGLFQAFFLRPKAPDLIWVPCFRQRDVSSALYWARRWECPIVFDPLISSYQKEVFEKKKWGEKEKNAVNLCRWEGKLFQQADLVIADTDSHARFYINTFGINPRDVAVIHVGADDHLFRHIPLVVKKTPIEVLFYGSYLPLQGPDVIIDAASISDDESIQWVLLGEGDSKASLKNRARDIKNVRFEPWIDYEKLPQRISQAQIVLGIFGTTPKASMVIPNKVFQSMAVGRPLVTLESKAYPTEISASDVIGWVPPGNPQALATCIRSWKADPANLAERGLKTRLLYEQFFSMGKLKVELQTALDKALKKR